MGAGPSFLGSVSVADSMFDKASVCVINEPAEIGGASSDEVSVVETGNDMRSAGFGKVLYVEPRDVYLLHCQTGINVLD